MAEIVRPHNEQLLKDLRMRLFYERVREITRNIERNKISYIATAIALRSALKDVER